jgi:hypothetical protein
MVQSENTTTRALEGSGKLKKVYTDCATACVKDLSESLMETLKVQINKQN